MNVLCLNAHPDDLELMAGGTISKWRTSGHNIHTLTLTDGVWKAPDGNWMRDKQEALDEEINAANYLGYTVENLSLQAMELQYSDNVVVEILSRIDQFGIDTIICPWEYDIHHDHEIVSRITVAASRRIPRILMGQINYYLRKIFTPNIFVDITDHWEQKINSLKMYEGQWSRAGEDWYEFLDATTKYYGKMIGVERAEGFFSSKFLIP